LSLFLSSWSGHLPFSSFDCKVKQPTFLNNRRWSQLQIQTDGICLQKDGGVPIGVYPMGMGWKPCKEQNVSQVINRKAI
jgi:hypothetical protein